MKKTLIWVGALTLLAGVGMYINTQIQMSYKLKYEYKNFRTPFVSKDKLVVEFDFIIENTGELTQTVRKIDIDVYGNDVFVTRIYSDKQFDILPNKKTTATLQMILNPAFIYQNAGQLASTGLNALRMKFKGYISIVKLGIGIPIPFVYNTTYKEFMGIQ